MSVKKKMAKGAAWMIGFKVIEQGIAVVSMIILARLLVPEDFGLVAMAMVIYALLELLGALGTDVVLIQRQDADRGLYDTAWTINAGVALVEGMLLALLAYPAALFYDEPRLQAIMYVLAASMSVSGLHNIGIVAFRKDLEFHKEFIFMVSRKLAGFMVTVPLAWYFHSYWALIAGMVTTRIAEIALSYWMHPFRPKFCTRSWHEIYHFSKWLYINNFFIFLNQRLAEFVLGKVAGPTSVGFYSIGNEVGTLPMTALVAPVNRAVYPGYAKLASDRKELGKAYIDVMQAIAIVALPAGFGLAVTADLLVPLLLGDQWLDAIPVVQSLAVAGAVGALLTNAGYGYMALGKPHIVTILMGLKLCLMVPAIYVGAKLDGASGAATGVLIAVLLSAPIELTVAVKVLQTGFIRILNALFRPLISTGLMMAACLLAQDLLSEYINDTLLTFVVVFIGVLTYSLVLIVTWYLGGRPEGTEFRIMQWGLKHISNYKMKYS